MFDGVIAAGAFGTVYHVIDRNDRKEYALKALEKSQVKLFCLNKKNAMNTAEKWPDFQYRICLFD